MSSPHAVVLYDGSCGFCDACVRFIIKRDPKAHFKFASLQSSVGRELAAERGLDATRLDSLVLIESGKAFQKSSATLRIAKALRWPWPIFAAFLLLPKALRDWFYDRFAARRYQWFGRKEACEIPSNADRGRFLA